MRNRHALKAEDKKDAAVHIHGKIRRVGETGILYVMATDAEYGEHLRARIDPFICGVGPVEAASNLAVAMASADLATDKVDVVVSLGSAGSNRLQQGHVYQIEGVSYRDMDASAFGFRKGATPFLEEPIMIPVEALIPDVPTATLSTGANVVSGDAYAAIEQDMVDMESFAVLRVCQQMGCRFVGLRGVSDGAEPVAELADWTRYLHVVDEGLADAVDRLEAVLGGANT
ncbi:MAG: 5'-methylthioadenosine/S-adenosylhomocysteine nucleosidase [Pseudomonadota bacterium]